MDMEREAFKISIIVPVFNAEQYLNRCVDSILEQTYISWELLLIDDGSTDSSRLISEIYSKKDPRIRVLHKTNGGVSSARNYGLDHAIGDYIVFVDADDYVEPTYLSSMCKDSSSELVVTSFCYETENEIIPKKQLYDLVSLECGNINGILMDAMYMVPWAKLFRRDIIVNNNIRFDERIHSGEDSLFVHTYLLYVKTILASSEITYHYSISGNGLSSRICPFEESLYLLDCYKQLLDKFEIQLIGSDMSHRYLWMTYDLFSKYNNSCLSLIYTEQKRVLKQAINNNHIQSLLLDDKIIPKGVKRRIWDYLALHNHYSLLTIYNKYFYSYD